MSIDCPGHSDGGFQAPERREYTIRGETPQEIAQNLANTFANNIGIKIDGITSTAKDRVAEISEECTAKTPTIIENEIKAMIGVLDLFKSGVTMQRASFENFDEIVTRQNLQEVGKRNIGKKVLSLLHALSRLPDEERNTLTQKYKRVLRDLDILCRRTLGFDFNRYVESLDQSNIPMLAQQFGGMLYTGINQVEIDLETLAVQIRLKRIFTDNHTSPVLNAGAEKFPERRGGIRRVV